MGVDSGAKSLLSRIDPFSKGFVPPGVLIGSHRKLFHFVKMAGKNIGVPIIIIIE